MSDGAGVNPDRGVLSRAVLALWHREGKWADVALEGVSMDPLIRHGARLRVRFATFSASDLKVGDVVIYAGATRLIAHRIIKIGRRGRRAGSVLAKGDPLSAWRASWVPAGDILGRVASVTQPDGSRLYLNTPAGRLLSRSAAWTSRVLGAIDAHIARTKPASPAATLTGRGLALLKTCHDAARRRMELEGEPAGIWVLSPEERFLATACRPRLRAIDIERIRSGDFEGLDWEQVRACAVSLGLAPLLFLSLSDPRLAGVCPEAALSRLSRASHISGYLTMQRRKELARVLSALGQIGIVPVLLKGAALTCGVYEDPLMRTMNDLDLLLVPGDIDRATHALEALSYRPHYRAIHAEPALRAAFYDRHHHAIPLIAPKGRAVVELHRHIVTMREAAGYDIERIRKRALPVMVEGHPAKIPAPVDLVLHTCLHLSYTDRFVGKLRDLIDLHETISMHGAEIDWGEMLAEVPADAVARCLCSCLDLARRLYGTPVPPDFLYELRRASRMGPVGYGLLRTLACSSLFNSTSSSRAVLSVATARWCCDTLLKTAGWSSRLRALAMLLAEG